ncbi:MAG: phage major capsid protein [Helicobacteraceae bacterium]|jgi:HK97 family phage major capsid protein/HK97 family phage prohead protease|nr:phage major capsid protein [Helicobacteraceae bacterium]
MKIDANRLKETQFREATIGKVETDRRTLELSFSSDQPIDRWFGKEILEHGANSVNFERLKNAAPLLLNHDTNRQIGVIQSAEVSDGKGRAIVRFSDSAFATEIFNDIQAGIRRNVSVGYTIDEFLEFDRGGDDFGLIVTKWTPYEISIVSIPADISVGVGRKADLNAGEKDIKIEKKEKEMPKEIAEIAEKETPVVDYAARNKEVAEILSIAKRHNLLDEAQEFIANGRSASEFKGFALEKIGERSAQNAPQNPIDDSLGLSQKEVNNFSLLRAINALINPNNRAAQEAAKYEMEVSAAASKKLGKQSRGVYIPSDMLKRTLTAGTATAGKELVPTELWSGDFIDVLLNKSAILQFAEIASGLSGNVNIPKETDVITAYWQPTETAAGTYSDFVTGQIALTPKQLIGISSFSRLLLAQSSLSVESLVRDRIYKAIIHKIEQAAVNGLGTGGEPKGLLNSDGVSVIALGTNGAAATWKDIVALETSLSNANADVGTLRYLTTPAVRGKLKTTPKESGQTEYIWDARGEGVGLVNGYNAYVSNYIPNDLTKGTGTNLSAILFGNFADIIVGYWGGIDIEVDPYTKADQAVMVIRAYANADVAIKRPESFAAILDAVTA